MLRRTAALATLSLAMLATVACDVVLMRNQGVGPQPAIQCGPAFAGPDCNDLLEIGLDVLDDAHPDPPLAIAVDTACPPNARCAASALGGNTAAVIVRWQDGTTDWATIPLPSDWPASAPGAGLPMSDPPPAHLLALVGVDAPSS